MPFEIIMSAVDVLLATIAWQEWVDTWESVGHHEARQDQAE